MKSNSILEHLLFQTPSLRKTFIALDLINIHRQIPTCEHKELKNILLPFKDPKIIAVWGLVETIALVSTEVVNRKMSALFISGNEATIMVGSKEKLIGELSQRISVKDYLPPPILRKIVYIFDYKECDGVMFSEISLNQWALDSNPLAFELNTLKKCGANLILRQIVSSLNEE